MRKYLVNVLPGLIWAALLSAALPAQAAILYAAPTAAGNGSGSSQANAADYTNATFWSNVQSTLASEAVTVFLIDGTYASGALVFSNKGHVTNQLVIQGLTDNGAVLNPAIAGNALSLKGSRNVMIKDLNFIGSACEGNSVYLVADGVTLNPCRDIIIDSCRFEDLTRQGISGLGESTINIASSRWQDANGWHSRKDAYNFTIRNCTFKRVGADRLAHAMYIKWGAHDITIHDNHFEDSTGVALKLRDEVDHVSIHDNTFLSTGNFANEDGSGTAGLIFIGIYCDNLNGTTEIFGNHYDIYNNSFTYASPVKNSAWLRTAMEWYFTGTSDVSGFNQVPSASEATTLSSGGPNYKRSFLSGAGIIPSYWTIYGNTYNSNVARRAFYDWTNGAGGDITNALAYQEVWNYNFEGDTGDPDGWVTSEGTNAQVYCTTASAGNGSTSVRLIDTTTADNCTMEKTVAAPITRGYYRTMFYSSSHTGDMFPVYTNSPGIYWIKALNTGKWGNNDGQFSGSPSWSNGNWYMLEVEFNFATDRYTAWVNNVKVANNLLIPTTATSLSSYVRASPALLSTEGSMLIDFTKLATYEP